MHNETFDDEKAYCVLQALNSVVMALIASHPDPMRLATELRREAEETREYLLDTRNQDEMIENIGIQILRFANFAEQQIPFAGSLHAAAENAEMPITM